MRILIAEDDVTSRRVLQTVLEKAGHEVVVARDGDEAWAVLEGENAPRLAILDWMMPGVDGVELCRRVRQTGPSNPTYIILLTALGGTQDIVVGLDAGADDHVTKPFHREELLARVQVGQRVLKLQSSLVERVQELQEALAQVKTLHGLLPICMHCHKIRNERESWERIEAYFSEHADVQFSHGCCPECLQKFYPEEDLAPVSNPVS